MLRNKLCCLPQPILFVLGSTGPPLLRADISLKVNVNNLFNKIISGIFCAAAGDIPEELSLLPVLAMGLSGKPTQVLLSEV